MPESLYEMRKRTKETKDTSASGEGLPYFEDGYDSKARFCSYWHQIHEIVSLKPRKVLEVGIGNGFLLDYLRKRGYNVTTVDIDEELNPDYFASVLSLPFEDDSFDVVACFEVLEHVAYSSFSQALREIHRVCRVSAVLSIPDSSRIYTFWLRAPRIGDIRSMIAVPRLKPRQRSRCASHFWEIGIAGYPLSRVLAEFKGAGFQVVRNYRLFEHPYHRFFVLGNARGR
ncbi:MAG: methyltransferase domain-containing protein [bacterium]|nr:methyltransferase domain-containing protein [bacterium]